MTGVSRILGWKLDAADRAGLLQRFPPRYPILVADHVTLGPATRMPQPWPVAAEVVGHVDDGAGLEALAVRLDGTTDRPDGSTYHITWSLADGRKPQQSNQVLKERGWAALADPIPIRLHPSSWS